MNTSWSDWLAAMRASCPKDYEVLANTVSSGVRLRAVHECGAMTEVDLRDEGAMWHATESTFRRVWSMVFESCYCVRPQPPCTHQRCEP